MFHKLVYRWSQGHVCKGGAGWGRLKGDRQGEKEAGGSRRDREVGLGEGGQGMGDKDGCWTTSVTKMEKSRNRDPGSGERKRREERSTKDERQLQKALMRNGRKSKKTGGGGCAHARVHTYTQAQWRLLGILVPGGCARQETGEEERWT